MANVTDKILKSLNMGPKKSVASSKSPGGIGYDNPRDNIDPHIVTKVLETKELKTNSQTITGALTVGSLHVTGNTQIDGDLTVLGDIIGTFGMCPIGSVIAWLESFTNTPTLPDGWVRCNGQTLADVTSVYNGLTIPDLNNHVAATPETKTFLRGSQTSGLTGGTQNHNHSLPDISIFAPPGSDTVGNSGSTGDAETFPPYYTVVWIMRVR